MPKPRYTMARLKGICMYCTRYYVCMYYCDTLTWITIELSCLVMLPNLCRTGIISHSPTELPTGTVTTDNPYIVFGLDQVYLYTLIR